MSLNQPLSENSKDAPNKIVEKKSEQLKKNNTKTLPHTIRQNDISIEDEEEILELNKKIKEITEKNTENKEEEKNSENNINNKSSNKIIIKEKD